MNKHFLFVFAFLSMVAMANAQLNQNPCKFLGNITTSYNWQEQADAKETNEKYYQLWDQITSENGSKWGSIHTARGQFNWTNADRAYNYAKEHGFPFKFHCLIWGSQYPSWIKNLSVSETYDVIVEWMDAVKAHYPDLELIDVVNEAICVNGKYHSPYEETKIIEALGGTGRTGYDWIIKAFHMARERWPNAKLIYNDYNTFRWQKNEFIALVRALIDGGAPIDAYGAQSHDLTDMEFDEFKRAMDETQQKLGIPMYITEYDIGTDKDALQLQRYKEQIPYMWEADYVAGVTLWGWIYGKTWTTNGNSGIVNKNGQGEDRPAMKWLREYMATDAAKNAKSPFCGGGSATIQLSANTIQLGDSISITATAKMQGEIDHIDFFAGDELLVHKYISPYVWHYTPQETGSHIITIVAYDKQGNEIEESAELFVCAARAPFKGNPAEIPGTIEVEEFDKGCDGIAFHDSDNKNEGDANIQEGGADIVSGGDNYAIGYTAADEWLEYTVNVTQSGNYALSAFAASGLEGSGFQLYLDGKELGDKITVPQTGEESWDVYKEITVGEVSLQEGVHTLRLTITNPYCNIDKLVFSPVGSGTSIKDVLSDFNGLCDVYTLLGVKVKSVNLESGDNNDWKSELKDGVYLLKNESGKIKMIVIGEK